MSFHPDLPPFVLRVEPDPEMQAALDAAIEGFVDAMLVARARLTADYGLKAWNEEPDAPAEPPCTHAGGHSRVEGWCVHCGHESEPAPAEVAPMRRNEAPHDYLACQLNNEELRGATSLLADIVLTPSETDRSGPQVARCPRDGAGGAEVAIGSRSAGGKSTGT